MSRPVPSPSDQRGRPRRRAVTVGAWIIGLAIVATAAFTLFIESEPVQGECLAGMDDRILLGLEVVDCADPDAKYQVVNHTDHSEQPCADHPDGLPFVNVDTRGDVRWSICAVPAG